MSLITPSVTKTVLSSCMALLVSGGAWFNWKGTDRRAKMASQSVVRASFPRSESPLKYDPANIQFAYEYIFLETIYSPLVEYDLEGKIKPAVAERFWWDGGSLHLLIREDLTTAAKKHITSDDVAFSLKRVMILGGNTHGNLIDLLCGDVKIRSVYDVCPGLEVDGRIVKLTPRKPTPFLLSMLTGIDFAVIPRSAVDPKSLKIIEMQNTSGPMYLESISPKGEIKLKRNETHFNVRSEQPNEIVLVPTSDSIKAFSEGQVDLITTIDSASAEDLLNYHSKHSNEADLHSSLDIRVFLLRFSSSALKHISTSARFAIGQQLVESIRGTFAGSKSLSATRQIVPMYGEGSLQNETLDRIASEMPAGGQFDRSRRIRVYLIRLPHTDKFKKAVTEVFPNAEFIDSNVRVLPNWGDEDSDLIISGPDMGFVEDISLYSYALKAGIFRTNENPDRWLESYMSVQDKESRIKMVRDLHENNLRQGYAFPIFTSPYVALARKPWTVTLPKLFANHPLWQIQFQP